MALPASPRLAGASAARRPFDALDADWAVLCRRHRRSTILTDWARREPALAAACRLGDVVPPAGVDRRPYCQALARIAAAGDQLGARALLQLLVPGLVRLATRRRWQFGSMAAAGWDVIARAGIYIARLGETEVGGSVAGWLLRSIERDLVDEHRRTRRDDHRFPLTDPTEDTSALSRAQRAASAEDTALAGLCTWGALSDAIRRGAVSAESGQIVLLHAAGHSMPEVARNSGTSPASVYRLRDRGHAQLRDHLAATS